MTPQQRNAAMDELAEIDRQLHAVRQEIHDLWGTDDDDLEDDLFVCEEEAARLEHRQDELLNLFPEVRYWPNQLTTDN